MKDVLRLRRLHLYSKWLWEAHVIWGTVLILVVTIAIAFWLRTEAAFRWSGLVLQILGILTVVRNINSTRTLFSLPSASTLVTQWWGKRPRFGASTQIALGAAAGLAISGGRPRVSIWHNADPNASSVIEARLNAAEKNLIWIRDQLTEASLKITQGLRQQDEALKQEKKERATNDKVIRDTLEAAQVGGLYISAMGVVWLIAGVIMSTVPNELTYAAKFLFP